MNYLCRALPVGRSAFNPDMQEFQNENDDFEKQMIVKA